MKISFLGGGNMASALIGGLLARGHAAVDMTVADVQEASRERLSQQFGVRAVAALDAAALDCEVLVLAVKPQQMRAALGALTGQLTRQIVVSIAAGLRIETLARWLGGYRGIVRCMPNTPALIGAGVTGLYADASVGEAGYVLAEQVLGAVGSTLRVRSEDAIDGVTALSGSGPAYVFRFIEALEAAALDMGFDAPGARRLALDTVLGAARLAAGSEEAPAVLRERVTSPGGTTAAALASFEQDDFMGVVARAVRAAEARGRELGRLLDQD